MNSKELLQKIGNCFCDKAKWPGYVELDLQLLDSGGIEPLLSKLDTKKVKVVGRDGDSTVRFSTLAAYSEYATCGCEDLDRFAKITGYFADQAIDANSKDSIKDLSITALEIADFLDIKGIELSRIIKLIDEFGSELHRGGRRGSMPKDWNFTVRPNSVYFQNVESIKEYEERYKQVQENRQRKREREKETRERLSGGYYQNNLSPTPASSDFEKPKALYLNLHPAVESTSRELLENGHEVEAVRAAAQRFEAFLQDILGNHDMYGLPLVGAALGGDPPKLRLNSGSSKKDEAEQLGYHLLAKGVISALRNFYSHGHPERIEYDDAVEYLAIISAVWKRIENANGDSDT